MIRTRSYLKDHRGVLAAGLVLAAMAAAPMPMWGQWNGTNPVWTNSNVGIGTNNPLVHLQVQQTADAPTYGLAVVNSAVTRSTFLWTDASNISRLDGGASGTYLLVLNAGGGNVGIGTTNPQYLLSVKGTVGAQEFIVTNTGWSDYVFRPGYRLRPLSEVSQYIQTNGHLPDIPTEAEVKEKGVSIGDMQAKLLAKVGELTLHMIQQEKQNRELRENLTKENQELRERLAHLEKGATTDSTPAVAK